MNNHGRIRLVLSLVILFILCALEPGRAQNVNEPPASKSGPASIRSATVITIHGKIVGIDRAKKQITLEAANGRRVTFAVANPYNIEAARVGDPVIIRYFEVVTVRKKRPGESVQKASIEEGIATAKPGGLPGAVAEQKIEIELAVTAIDPKNGTVTVRAPDGSMETVKAAHPQNLELIKVGDDLIVTLDRATAISVVREKATN